MWICKRQGIGKDVGGDRCWKLIPEEKLCETSGLLLTNLPFTALTNLVDTNHQNSEPSHFGGHEINSSCNQQRKVYS